MFLESSTSSSSSSSGEEPGSGVITSLSRKERIARKTSEMDNVAQDSYTVLRRARRPEKLRKTRRRRSNVKKMMMEDTTSVCHNGCEEDEKAEVERRIMELQRIVPGGESLGVDKLFEETAGYILALQFQVKALKFLASFVEGSDKEKRKLGG